MYGVRTYAESVAGCCCCHGSIKFCGGAFLLLGSFADKGSGVQLPLCIPCMHTSVQSCDGIHWVTHLLGLGNCAQLVCSRCVAALSCKPGLCRQRGSTCQWHNVSWQNRTAASCCIGSEHHSWAVCHTASHAAAAAAQPRLFADTVHHHSWQLCKQAGHPDVAVNQVIYIS